MGVFGAATLFVLAFLATGLDLGLAGCAALGVALAAELTLASGVLEAGALGAEALLAAGFLVAALWPALASSEAVILRGLSAPSFKRTGFSPQISSNR